MKKTIATICAGAVALTTLAAAMPAEAASPSSNPLFQQVSIQHPQKPRFEKHGNYAYLNGHRGDHHFHPGYRQYGGYWFPPAAFIGMAIGAAIVGGILSHAY